MAAQTAGDELKTVATSYEVIELLRDMDGARVSEIADAADVSTTTAHRHLSTLVSIGYAVNEGGSYYLSTRFIKLGRYARNKPRTAAIAEDKVRELAVETGERAQYDVKERARAVCLRCETGEHAVSTDSGIGRCVPLHSTAAGKAILAHQPEERVDELLDRRGMPAMTANTITDRETLRSELATVRQQGYATNVEEHIKGLYAVAVPVRRRSGESIGALSVYGPLHRMYDEATIEEVSTCLLEAANEVELEMEFDGR